MKYLCLALICMFGAGLAPAKDKGPSIYTIPLPPKPDFSSLHWLAGQWVGETTGKGPKGQIHLSVEPALDGNFMILREEVSLAATESAPAVRESWMGVLGIGHSGTDFVLRTYSSTGFVTRYSVTVDGSDIYFNPEGGEKPPPGWLFRRVIEQSGMAEIKETLQAAPPNKPFFTYYKAKLSRAGSN